VRGREPPSRKSSGILRGGSNSWDLVGDEEEAREAGMPLNLRAEAAALVSLFLTMELILPADDGYLSGEEAGVVVLRVLGVVGSSSSLLSSSGCRVGLRKERRRLEGRVDGDSSVSASKANGLAVVLVVIGRVSGTEVVETRVDLH
jgi:hypothetical protein